MIPLLLATFFSASFGLVVRYAQGHKGNLWAVGALNYATAALFHVARGAGSGGLPPSRSTLLLGLLGGCVYVGSYFLLFPFMRQRGVSVATAILRLSVVMPIAIAILFWGERPGALQSAGALLALMSLPLLARRPVEKERPTRNGDGLKGRGILLLVALFVGNGLCMMVMRGYEQTGVRGESSLFLAILFGTAAVIALIGWLTHRQGSSRRDLLPGVLLGLLNALGNLALVIALQQLPAVVVFPFHSAVGLVYVALFARLVWDERIARTEAAGMALALVAVVLINLG